MYSERTLNILYAAIPSDVRLVCMVIIQLFSSFYIICILGCQNTPAKSSRFCSEHNNLASKFQDDSGLMIGNENCEEELESKFGEELLPMRILNDKKTRNGKFFEVNICNQSKYNSRAHKFLDLFPNAYVE